ncbi:hypothetical protein [Phaffia rhodozyma]|uniref:Uncharacterized protein n=1 Tax=Phaffia rhodozyma TaxID=264483 RepID=A0A0F7SRY3_PHARH|nr:hypothetical protein [Phaffia rhodozyma]
MRREKKKGKHKARRKHCQYTYPKLSSVHAQPMGAAYHLDICSKEEKEKEETILNIDTYTHSASVHKGRFPSGFPWRTCMQQRKQPRRVSRSEEHSHNFCRLGEVDRLCLFPDWGLERWFRSEI